MTISMYQVAVPTFVQILTALDNVLGKAAAHAESKKIDEAAFLNARLFPDMLPLTTQVQIASDFARGTCARLAGVEMLSIEDNETSFAALRDRIKRSVDYVRTFKPEQIDGTEAREVVRSIRGEPKKFTGVNYLLQFALPNFYFHATATYAILRHNGVDIGKRDFYGQLD